MGPTTPARPTSWPPPESAARTPPPCPRNHSRATPPPHPRERGIPRASSPEAPMDTTARTTQAAADRSVTVAARAATSGRQSRRRRPSGAPPPLPRHLETTGIGWLLAAVGLVTVLAVSFAAS